MSASPFAVRTYRHLFGAQLVALSGTGLATVALGLLAFELAGTRAAGVLATALTIKMVTYVVIAPVAGAYADQLDRRRMLVALDLVRASVVLALPFVDHIWQVYLLVAILQSASAAFTPTFQAALPEVLPREEQYTRALSYSQLASTLETLLSPLIAAVVMSFIDFHWLFAATAVGFAISAGLVVTSRVPDVTERSDHRIAHRILVGVRIFAATPRLRGVMGLNLAVASAGAIVMVNTVNLVREHLARPDSDVAWLLTAHGAGVLAVAVFIPRLLSRFGERTVTCTGAMALTCGAAATVVFAVTDGGTEPWPVLLAIWALIGLGTGAVLTPIGTVLRRSSSPADRPALFAAQFSLSHACWLITYPIAGWVATTTGYTLTWSILAALAALGALAASRLWPAGDPLVVEHHHPFEIAEPAHVAGAILTDSGYTHSHELVIDHLHPHWPSRQPPVAS